MLKAAMLQVVSGWEIGILGDKEVPAIKEGGLRTLLIPPELAYGMKGDECYWRRVQGQLAGLPSQDLLPVLRLHGMKTY